MPPRHSPLTLRKAAILSIGKNWDRICYGVSSPSEMSVLLENDGFLQYSSPFTHLPSSILEDMLGLIAEKRSLSRKFLHHLILEQLVSLNLGFGIGEVHYGFQFLQRCKKLQKLSLAYLRHIEPTKLMSVIPYLPHIVSLNLNMTFTTDEVLELIADFCPCLADLNLISTMVTDHGLMSLCGVNQNDGVKRCQRMKILRVTDTRVTWIGALVALHNLPELTDFDFDKIFQAFEHLDPDSLSDVYGGALKLRTLNSVAALVRSDSIDAAATLCPKAEILSLASAWMDNETLYKFMRFENLKSLTIINNEEQSLDFDEGVLPLFQVCGPTLQNLILNKFAYVDLLSLGRSCIFLKKMALCNIGSYQTSTTGKCVDNIYCHLSALELWFDDRTEFCSGNVIHQLLHSSVNLSNLLVKQSDSFRLDVLRIVWDTNPLKKLSRLTLDQCHSVDITFLQELLQMDNELTVLRLWSCSKIGQEERHTLSDLIKANNFDVYLEWFE